MRSLALLAFVVLAVTCGPSPDAQLPGWVTSMGGDSSPGTGGVNGTGGRTGGKAGSGGATEHGAGGRSATGGRSGSGGRTITGGRDGGAGGRGGAGGTEIDGTGGRTIATGGADGGIKKDAGKDGGGGSIGPKDAPVVSPDLAENCYTEIVNNGYACGSTPACSECIVNGVSKEASCQKGIDCLSAAGASCDSNCKLNCLNQAGDATVQACITTLQTAACSGAGCGNTTLRPRG